MDVATKGGMDRAAIKQIFKHLEKAISLNEKRRARTLEDPDLRSLSGYPFFQKLKEKLNFDSTNDVEWLIHSSAWRSSNDIELVFLLKALLEHVHV